MSRSRPVRVKSCLLDLVLPLETDISDGVFPGLAKSLQGTLVSRDLWLSETSHLSAVNKDIREEIFLVTLDFYKAETSVLGHLLVFSLFLQKMAVRGKRLLGQRRKLTDDELLSQFLSDSWPTLKTVFEGNFLKEILSIALEKSEESPGMEEVIMQESLETLPDSHGVIACIKNGTKLTWNLANKKTVTKAKMATTADVEGGGRKQIVLSQLTKQTLVKDSDTLRGSSLLVHRCRQSQLFLPSRLQGLKVTKCEGLMMVVGAVRGTVRVSGCRNSTLVVTARRLMVQACVNCTFHLFSPSKPLVGPSSHNITFAPLNINYEGLAGDMKEAGLEPGDQNHWNSPLVVSNTPLQREVCHLQPEQEFDLAMFPVSSGLLSPLVAPPPTYQAVVEEKTRRVTEWEEMLSKLDVQQSDIYLPLLQKKFNDFIEKENLASASLISNIESLMK